MPILNTTAGQYESPYGTSEEAWKTNIRTTPSVSDQENSPYSSTESSWKSNVANANVAVPQPQTEQATTETPVTTDSPSIEVRLTQQGSNAKASNPGGNTKGQEETVTSPWAGGFQAGLDSNPDMSIADAINGYNGWAKENGNDPLDIFEIYSVLNGNDPSKSLAQNESDRKKAERRERWERVTNVLSHLGNFVGALAGAPDQGIESSIELTKRQQLLRDKTLEQRRQANNDFLKVYQAQQAAKMAADKEKREAAYQNETLKLKQAAEERQRDAQTIQLMRLNWQMQYQQGLLDLKKQQQEIDNAYKMGQLSLRGKQLALNELKANYTNVKVKPDGTVETIEHRVGASGTPTPPSANNGGGNTGGQRQRQVIDY